LRCSNLQTRVLLDGSKKCGRLVGSDAVVSVIGHPDLDSVQTGRVEEPPMGRPADPPAVIPAVAYRLRIFNITQGKTFSDQPNSEPADQELVVDFRGGIS